MPSNHLVLYHSPLLLPSIFPGIRVLSNELALHLRWPKYWNFSFSISPSNEYSGLISFRMDWFDLLAIQGILKSSPIVLLEFSLPSLLSLVTQMVNVCLQCRRPRFNPWVRKIPCRREWQPTPVFLPGESLGQRSLAGYSPWGCKESDLT